MLERFLQLTAFVYASHSSYPVAFFQNHSYSLWSEICPFTCPVLGVPTSLQLCLPQGASPSLVTFP